MVGENANEQVQLKKGKLADRSKSATSAMLRPSNQCSTTTGRFAFRKPFTVSSVPGPPPTCSEMRTVIRVGWAGSDTRGRVDWGRL